MTTSEEVITLSQQVARPHFEGLETAFLQLSFAMKVWHYIQEHPLPPEEFDISLTIQEDNGSRYVMPSGEFNDASQVEVAAGNNIAICFGVTAITLWEAIREHSGLESHALDPSASEREMLAGLSFAIRCCFAHGTVRPVWKLASKYRIEFSLGNRRVDLRSADGSPFDYSQLGGVDGLRILRNDAGALGLV
jgi:hypothetical protein